MAETNGNAEFDVLVVGAGLAGMSAAILLARKGFSVAAIDHASPVRDAAAPGADLRTTALLEPAIETLREAGVWERLEGRTAQLRAIRMIDAGAGPESAVSADFSAQELDREAFGANVANPDLKDALWSAAEAEAEASGRLTLIAPMAISQLLLRQDAALARLADGRLLRARLAVAADGRDSAVRTAAGVPSLRHDFGQNAIVFVVAHDQPHDDVSTEILNEGGPFTLVPFTPDPVTGRPRSSVVWMERRAAAGRLMALDDAGFEAAAQDRSLGRLGALSLVSRRASFPIASMLAAKLHGRRAAIIAEAAHVAPPVGAQGLNMSLGDVKALAEILETAREAGKDIGAPEVLRRLTRERYAEVAGRVAATATLNSAAIGDVAPLRELRRAGLSLIHGVAPLKRAAMRFGLG